MTKKASMPIIPTAVHRDTLLAKLTLSQLLAGLEDLHSRPNKTQEERMTHGWLAQEVEDRFPEIDEELDSYFADNHPLTNEPYVVLLKTALKAKGILK